MNEFFPVVMQHLLNGILMWLWFLGKPHSEFRLLVLWLIWGSWPHQSFLIWTCVLFQHFLFVKKANSKCYVLILSSIMLPIACWFWVNQLWVEFDGLPFTVTPSHLLTRKRYKTHLVPVYRNEALLMLEMRGGVISHALCAKWSIS